MRNKHYSSNQILVFLKMGEECASIPEMVKSIGVSERTYYRWKVRYASGESSAEEFKRLREENTQLKTLNAQLLIETKNLLEVISKLCEESVPE